MAVKPEYPLSPDSTVVRFALPHPLAPGVTMRVRFAWEARPSATIFRRQGRRGRHYDFAQWYPKVAVYDRGGWEVNAFRPAGELYGEFGDFDVTIIAANDQVLGASGVPVDGDPGWERVRVGDAASIDRNVYGALPPAPAVTPPSGMRAVRFFAHNVHHFAWAASPDYVYEGGTYRGAIAIHVLYEPKIGVGWKDGAMVENEKRALAWLESIYGPYGYPEVVAMMRLEGGATEFPMSVMYGPGVGLGITLHETGHLYSYGMLANNEWRSGWMDEGLTDYQTSWAQNMTVPEIARGLGPQSRPATGYRAHATTPPWWELGQMQLIYLDLIGRDEPIGTSGKDFNEFYIYNEMVYSRASWMYGALRNLLGDSLFRAFLHDYYARWQFKHVDELAMRASAERVSGRDLSWFFDEWVHHTGLVDYALENDSAVKVGEYIHPMSPVPTAAGKLALDPQHLTPDWDTRNNGQPRNTKWVFGWPFLDQYDRYENVAEVSPLAWYTNPGGMTFGARVRTNYQDLVDEWDFGLAMATRGPGPSALPQLQGWIAVDNPRFPWSARPVIGLHTGVWMEDGTFKFTLRRNWDESPFYAENGGRDTLTIGMNVTAPYDRAWQDTLRWSDAAVADAFARWSWRSRRPGRWFAIGTIDGGLEWPRGAAPGYGGFGSAQGEVGSTFLLTKDQRLAAMLRAWGGVSSDAPMQRSLGLSSLDPTETYDNDFLRGQGAIFVQPAVPYVPLGGAGMRGYSLYVRVASGGSLNTQLAYTVFTPQQGSLLPRLQGAVFADLAYADLAAPYDGVANHLGDAGVSAILKGALYDRRYALRIDVPIWLSAPRLAAGNAAGTEKVAARWTFTLGDLW